jgi:hypothetical protein
MTDLERFGLRPQLPAAFDHQVTGTFGECERMAYYKHILGRDFIRGDRTALNWGKVFHDCTELWDVTSDLAQIHGFISESLEENEGDRYGRTQGRMFEAFKQWLMFRQMNPLEILRTEQPVLIRCDDGESCPYFPETGCGLEYGGRMDRIVRWDAMIGPLDFKTTVMDEQDPIGEYRPSHQFEGYVWAASHLMNQHAWGIIVERIVTNKSKIDIRRFPVSFTRDQIREWVQNEKRVQSRILHLFQEHPTDELEWVQNYFRCFKPWPCEFRDACLASRDMDFRYRWLRDNTVEKRWDFRNPSGQAVADPAVIVPQPLHEVHSL